MDEQITKLTRTLQIEYGVFIFLAAALCLCYEADWLPVGYYAHDARMQYILGTAGILTTIALVPLSLKLFSFTLIKKIKETTLPKALKLYKVYSEIRIGILTAIVLMNIIIYYFTLQNLGGLCALIGLTASFFCLPSEKKIRKELNFD